MSTYGVVATGGCHGTIEWKEPLLRCDPDFCLVAGFVCRAGLARLN
jgi:hypothetical protein